MNIIKNRKLVVLAFLVIVAFSFGVYWYQETRADVKIVTMEREPLLALRTVGELNLTLCNYGPKPVNVLFEVENAFVSEKGERFSTARMVIAPDSQREEAGYMPISEPVSLLPGNNSISIQIGYALPGEYPVKVMVFHKGRLLDEGTFLVKVPPPELALTLGSEHETVGTYEVYRIDGYLINRGLSPVIDVLTNITVTEVQSGRVVLIGSRVHGVAGYDKMPLHSWEDNPYAIIELAREKPSEKSYMPVEYVVKGRVGEHYRVNVTSTWHDQTVSAEILVPQA